MGCCVVDAAFSGHCVLVEAGSVNWSIILSNLYIKNEDLPRAAQVLHIDSQLELFSCFLRPYTSVLFVVQFHFFAALPAFAEELPSFHLPQLHQVLSSHLHCLTVV
jgi:hypothetical protein